MPPPQLQPSPLNPAAPARPFLSRERVEASLRHRAEVLLACRESARAREIQLAACRESVVWFAASFAVTYDPRVVARRLPTYLPFDLFPRQVQLLEWLDARAAAPEEGLVEKSRDVGWTWVAALWALHKWLFVPGFRTTFGSRKVDLVDKLGEPDSILEKVRLMIDRLPPWMHPKGYRREAHAQFCKIVNPENGNVIGGEGGDEMGRGGRATAYVVDEAAYVSHADSVAAAILANSDCRIWASSVNGPGDFFARKRHDGTLRLDQIFTFHYTDDPRKDAAWARAKKAELAGTPWLWAQEYDIDYSASVEGVIIPAAWVAAAVRLGELLAERGELPLRSEQAQRVGGLDIGDGCARSVLQPRFGPLLTPPRSWGEPDTTDTAFRALDACEELGVDALAYDTIGVGKGVASTLTKNPREGLRVHPVNVGDAADWRTVWPGNKRSNQLFVNLKAELWWTARERFRTAARLLVRLAGEPVAGIEPPEEEDRLRAAGAEVDVPAIDDAFVFEPAEPHAYRQTIVELSLPTRRYNSKGKIQVESKDDLRKRGVASPDHAEGVILSLARVGPGARVPRGGPIVVTSPRGIPALDGRGSDPLHSPLAPRGGPPLPPGQPAHSPVVLLPGRFARDFARDH